MTAPRLHQQSQHEDIPFTERALLDKNDIRSAEVRKELGEEALPLSPPCKYRNKIELMHPQSSMVQRGFNQVLAQTRSMQEQQQAKQSSSIYALYSDDQIL